MQASASAVCSNKAKISNRRASINHKCAQSSVIPPFQIMGSFNFSRYFAMYLDMIYKFYYVSRYDLYLSRSKIYIFRKKQNELQFRMEEYLFIYNFARQQCMC